MPEGRGLRAIARASRVETFAQQSANIQTHAFHRRFVTKLPAPVSPSTASQSHPEISGTSSAQTFSEFSPTASLWPSPPSRSGALPAACSKQAGSSPRCRQSTTTEAQARTSASEIWRSRAASESHATRGKRTENREQGSAHIGRFSPLVPQSLSPCHSVIIKSSPDPLVAHY